MKKKAAVIFLIVFFTGMYLASAATAVEERRPFIAPGVAPPNLTGLTAGELAKVSKAFDAREGDVWLQLTNGLTIFIRPITASNVVSLRVHVNTGSIHEDFYAGAGVSHYLEHVVSGGSTGRRTEDQINDLVKSIGGASNAYTSYDGTVYFIETTGEHSATALDVLLDTVFHCRFDEKEVAREKGVITRELLMGDNDPTRAFWKFFMETAYQRSPVRYPIIGYKELFDGLTRDKILDYYRRRYVPDNAMVCVVGNVDPIALIKQVISQVGEVPRGLVSQVLPAEPVQMAPRYVEMASPLAKIARVQIGFPSIELTHPDLYALDVLAMIVGEGRTSRLYRALRDKYQSVVDVSASSWTPHFVPGLFLISLTLDYQNIAKSLDQMWEEIERIQKEGPSPEEFRRAQKKVQASYVFSQESTGAMAREISSSYTSARDPYFNRHYSQLVQEVNIDQIKVVANRYLRKEKATVAVLKPLNEKTAAGRKAEPKNDRASTVQKTVLDNGLTLITKVNTASPTVSIRAFGPGGLLREPENKPGISLFATSLMTKGTEHYSKQELARMVEDMGASLSAGSGRNSFFVNFDLLSADLDKGLELLGEVLLRPVFPQEEIDQQRGDTLKVLKTLDEDWGSELNRMLNRAQFTHHPFRNDLPGTEQSVSSFKREGLAEFHRSLLKPNHMVIAVFGDIDPQKVLASVKHELGGLKPGDPPPLRVFPDEYTIRKNENLRKDNEKSSAGIMMAFNGFNVGSPERPALDVLDALTSGIGYPSGWLQESLRGGDKDLVYVVHAYPRYAPDGGNFLVMAQSYPQNLSMVKQIILDQLNRLQTEPLNPEEFERARQAVIINHEMSLETNAEQASSAALNELLGLGWDFDRKYLQQVRGVTEEDVKRVAGECLGSAITVETFPAAFKQGG